MFFNTGAGGKDILNSPYEFLHSTHCVQISDRQTSNGNIFRVTDTLCRELTAHWWIPLTKASDTEFDVFFDPKVE